MKTFDEIKNNVEQDELNEGRLIRKGTAIYLQRMHECTRQSGRTVLQGSKAEVIQYRSNFVSRRQTEVIVRRIV